SQRTSTAQSVMSYAAFFSRDSTTSAPRVRPTIFRVAFSRPCLQPEKPTPTNSHIGWTPPIPIPKTGGLSPGTSSGTARVHARLTNDDQAAQHATAPDNHPPSLRSVGRLRVSCETLYRRELDMGFVD